MGTIGGKIGFLLGIGSAFLFAPLTIQLLVEPCFFEGGCSSSESVMLLLAAVAALSLAVISGLIVRFVVNRLLEMMN